MDSVPPSLRSLRLVLIAMAGTGAVALVGSAWLDQTGVMLTGFVLVGLLTLPMQASAVTGAIRSRRSRGDARTTERQDDGGCLVTLLGVFLITPVLWVLVGRLLWLQGWSALRDDDFWQAVIVTTVVSAVPVALLLLAPATIKRKLRALRGQCIHCGYDLRSGPDTCPECGAAVGRHRPLPPMDPSSTDSGGQVQPPVDPRQR